MTWGNSKISERSFGEGSVRMGCQRPETLNQTNDSLQKTFAGGADWTEGSTV